MKENKDMFVTAYVWSYGVTKKEAMKQYTENKKAGNEEYINAIIEGFTSNAEKAFYND